MSCASAPQCARIHCAVLPLIRSEGATLTVTAHRIGIARNVLDRWERAGLVRCSFTRRRPISGVGTVDARLWTKEGAERIARRRGPQGHARHALKRAQAGDAKRIDRTEAALVTIDPARARDHGDAVLCTPLGRGLAPHRRHGQSPSGR